MTKMNYAEAVAEILGGEVKIVEKANGVEKYGIIVGGNEKVRPTVYIDKFYEDGTDVVDAASQIREFLKDANMKSSISVDDIHDYDKMKGMLKARLYNKKTKAEVYKSAAEYGFDDLIIIPVIQFDDEASTRVLQRMLDEWGKTAEEVIEIALENSKGYEMTSLGEFVEKVTGMPTPSVPVQILTNETKTCGAITAITQREMLKEEFGEYIIIPSSIHEVLVVAKDELNASIMEMSKMVVEVNQSQVAPEEILSDHVYEF